MRIVHNDIAGGLLILALFAAVIVIIEVWTRLRHPDPELSRKAVHILGGVGSLLFPFVVGSPVIRRRGIWIARNVSIQKKNEPSMLFLSFSPTL